MKDKRWTLEGKLALVTGGTKGIGKGIAEELVMHGARVIITSRSIEEEMQGNDDIIYYRSDASVKADRSALVGFVADKFNRLDILINNVGTNIRKPTVSYTDTELDFLLQTNLISSFSLTRDLYLYLKKAEEASVVNISSVGGLKHLRTGSVYGRRQK